jgi:hypothetical protein
MEKTKPHWGWIAAAVVAVVLVFAFLGDDDEPGPDSFTNTPSEPAESEAITLSNFGIDLVVLESQCFDTAGGLVTVEPDVSAVDVPPAGYRATLVYEIRGGENTETFNIEITGSDYSYDEHLISTADCSDELTVVPTRLLER